MTQKEDVHFLLDNAPPEEVEFILRCLDVEIACSIQELRKKMLSDWRYSAQSDMSYSTRRLFDLGLSDKQKTISKKPGHILTELGKTVRNVLYRDKELYHDIMHFLHYTGYDANDPSSRKLFWSYKVLCNTIWDKKKISSSSHLVQIVQSKISAEFSTAYQNTKKGGIFNSGGVSNWKRWLKALSPPPITNDKVTLVMRETEHFELPLLALDYIYCSREIRYGDPIILDKVLLDEISRSFLLEPTHCRELLTLANRLTNVIDLADTFSGMSITLLEPCGINRL